MAVHLPKGTRDFLPQQMHARHLVMARIRAVFDRFGFEPLDTPAFERLDTLTGKYGDETDKLMYRIHKRGRNVTPGECDLGLRYDLTVPLARVVAMHPELRMPFKRWQMAPVWRAERNQRGRFREFWQCDVDTLGTLSPLADAECVAVAAECLKALGFHDFVISLNDRRILADLAARAGATDTAAELRAILVLDKLDKIGADKVAEQLREAGLDPAGLAPLFDLAAADDDDLTRLDRLEALLDERGRAGLATLREVRELALGLGVAPANLRVDPTLARGSDYYTGPVFEARLADRSVGSVAGGGRYDGLVGALSGRDVPAVGISLGLERLLVVLEESDQLDAPATAAPVLVTVFDETCRGASLDLVRRLRDGGVAAELFVGATKMGKQFKYANARGFRWLTVIGPDERDAGRATLKDLLSGEQHALDVDEVVRRLVEATA